MFGWCSWEIEEPDIIPGMRRFLERLGRDALAAELRAVEADLAEFPPEVIAAFFEQTLEDAKTRDAIRHALDWRFRSPAFEKRHNATIWNDIAEQGAARITGAGVYSYHAEFKDLHAANKRMI